MERKGKPFSTPPGTALPGVNDAAADHLDPERSAPFLIACVGASAGGIEATTTLLGALDPDTGVAFVLIQHLDPMHKTMLAEIFGRATPMQVVIASDRQEVLPNRIYVIPPGKSMVIGEGMLQLAPRTELRGQHRPVDHFLRSLAEEHGHKSIAIILSGMGSDGSLGLEEIKAAGGITFAQDNSAEQSSMPRHASATGCVDAVLSPAAIAAEINRIARHPVVRRDMALVPEDHSREAFDRIIAILRDSSDVDFSNYKRNTLHRRIARRMVLHRFDNLDQYAQFLTDSPAEAEALYQDVLINVTSFFRDPQAYDALKEKVFPELTSERSRHEPVRVWALGCSTGEEAYSIAMAYTEFAEASGRRVPLQVFATDLNSAGIERARTGVYPKSIEQDVDAERLRRFFIDIDGSYRICKPIRDMCIFARQNLLADPPFSRIDLVACRNVLIYLQPVLQQRLIPMLHYALRGRGFLWLGMSETIGSYADLFEMQDARYKVYRRKEAALRARAPVPITPREVTIPPARPLLPRAVASSDALREADRVLAARYAPPGVVVGADMDIVQFRGDTSPYLTLLPGRPSFHLLKMAREGLGLPLRRAIQGARREGVPVREEGVPVPNGEHPREISIEVIPLTEERSEGAVLVLFDEYRALRPPVVIEADAAGPPSTGAGDAEQEIARLRQELAGLKEYLQSMVEQHDASNEELQSANEEVQSANEELQSINEELETSKEEIQSSNEELATVNDELQNRNLELSLSNNDMVSLLASVNMAIVMLGRDLRIRRLTPAAEKVLNLIPTDVGRPISDIKLPIDLPDLESLLADVVDTVTAHEREVRDRSGRWYLLRARAYRTTENRIDGAVLMLIDIDLHKRTELALGETESRFALLADSAPVLIWVMDLQELREINRAYRDFVGVEDSTLARSAWVAFIHPDDRDAYLALYRERCAHREPFESQFRLRRADGEYRWMKSVAAPRTTGSGEFLGYVGCSFDISDLKSAETALRDADAAKTRFLAVLAHEFRTPLAAVSNAVQIMGLAAPDSERYRSATTILARQTSNMARLLEDLVDLSRITHGLVRLQKGRVNLVDCLQQAIEVASQEPTSTNVRIVADLPPEPIWLDADPLRLDQVFTNLLTNAIKFSPDGGTVRVAISRESESREPTGSTRTERWPEVAVVRISDQGIGLEADMLERVFDPFVQVDRQRTNARPGMGLGLALARQLVELHEGSVRASSEGLGKGTVLTVRLPARPAQPQARRPLHAANGGSRPLLIVEDNADAAEALRLMLELASFDVEVAVDGAGALAAARRRLPDIILLDINMPDMSGWDVARELRKDARFAHTLIIAVSGLGMPEDRERSEEAGIDHHFTKPVSLQSLLGAIEDWQHGVASADHDGSRD